MTAGELITLLQGVGATTPLFIRIVVPGGISRVVVNGFTAADTILTKPVELFTINSIA